MQSALQCEVVWSSRTALTPASAPASASPAAAWQVTKTGVHYLAATKECTVWQWSAVVLINYTVLRNLCAADKFERAGPVWQSAGGTSQCFGHTTKARGVQGQAQHHQALLEDPAAGQLSGGAEARQFSMQPVAELHTLSLQRTMTAPWPRLQMTHPQHCGCP